MLGHGPTYTDHQLSIVCGALLSKRRTSIVNYCQAVPPRLSVLVAGFFWLHDSTKVDIFLPSA